MSESEAIAAARALLPGAAWVPYAFSGLPFVGGLAAGACGEPRVWLVAALWGAGMAGCWGDFNPLGAVQWVVGGVGLAAAGWACFRGGQRRRYWLVGPPLALILGLGLRAAPVAGLTAGTLGGPALVELALARAEAGEVDEGIVYAEAGMQLSGGSPTDEASAALVLASLYAAEGDCDSAVTRARIAHATLGPSLPNLDEAIKSCFQLRGP